MNPERGLGQFTATSDDQQVSATVSARLDVLRVLIGEGCDREAAEQGIVQSVNRALAKAEGQPVEDLIRARDARVREFNALIEGLESEVDQTTAVGRWARRRG